MKKRLITKKQSRERDDKQVSFSSIEQANHRTKNPETPKTSINQHIYEKATNHKKIIEQVNHRT